MAVSQQVVQYGYRRWIAMIEWFVSNEIVSYILSEARWIEYEIIGKDKYLFRQKLLMFNIIAGVLAGEIH